MSGDGLAVQTDGPLARIAGFAPFWPLTFGVAGERRGLQVLRFVEDDNLWFLACGVQRQQAACPS
jgi:hypothetical protein